MAEEEEEEVVQGVLLFGIETEEFEEAVGQCHVRTEILVEEKPRFGGRVGKIERIRVFERVAEKMRVFPARQ